MPSAYVGRKGEVVIVNKSTEHYNAMDYPTQSCRTLAERHSADEFNGHVDNDTTDQQYSFDWNQIEKSYSETPHIGLGIARVIHATQPTALMEASFRPHEQVSADPNSSEIDCATPRLSRDTLEPSNFGPLGTDSLVPRPWPLQARSLDLRRPYSHESRRGGQLYASPENEWRLRGDGQSNHVALAALSATVDAEAASLIDPQAPPRQQRASNFQHTHRQQVTPISFQQSVSTPSLTAPAYSDIGLSPLLAQHFSNLDMVEGVPLPISPPSDDDYSRRTSSIDINMKAEPHLRQSEASANRAYPQAFKRERTPPRNSKDEIFCDHAECVGKRDTFSRTCEWNKHMDKHERPYKCMERGCERLLGFTYSGGLLRHNREVHKKNLATRIPLYCPFANCNRNSNSGHGFTRQENLNEHKRRRHPGEVPPTTPSQAMSPWATDADHKRKRDLNAVDERDAESDEATDDEETLPTKRSRTVPDGQSQLVADLRAEIEGKDAYIESLRTTIRALQQQNSSARGPPHGKWG